MTLAATIALWLSTIGVGVIIVSGQAIVESMDTAPVLESHARIELRQFTEAISRDSVDIDMKTGAFPDP